jgi:hypothetical protein
LFFQVWYHFASASWNLPSSTAAAEISLLILVKIKLCYMPLSKKQATKKLQNLDKKLQEQITQLQSLQKENPSSTLSDS